MSEVYFLEIKRKSPEILIKAGEKTSKLFFDLFDKKDKVAVKVHFGEKGSDTFLSPVLVKSLYAGLKRKVKNAVLVDCTVLYKSERSFAKSHEKLAREHGFSFAPISILDGEKGQDNIKIKVNKKHFKEVKIGAGIKNFNSVLAISHFKGHGLTGFGGALKNVGMGLGSKAGKLVMHKAFKLKIDPVLCRGCRACQRNCSVDAIFFKNEKAQINYDKCIGCGLCVSICPFNAVKMEIGEVLSKELQERIVEYAFGVLKNRKSFFINVLLDITPGCDCLRGLQRPMTADIGILISKDIVAIEQASLDLVGKKYFEKPDINPEVQINYAQKLGLGEKKYKLITI